LALDVVEHLGEVGQVVVEVIHHRQAGGLDLKALGALLEHALVGGAQTFMLPLRQLVELAADLVDTVEAAHAGDRDAAARPDGRDRNLGCGHRTNLRINRAPEPFNHSRGRRSARTTG
jgi:hypothetical protein